jgi:hypothetical protein
MRTFKFSLVAAMMVTIGAAGSAFASPRYVGAAIGLPAEGAPLASFTAHLGTITFNGNPGWPNGAWWEVPLVADMTQWPNATFFSPVVVGIAATEGGLQCAARSVTGDGVSFYGTALVAAPAVGPMVSTWSLGSIGVAPGYSLVVDCLMQQGSMVNSVSFW